VSRFDPPVSIAGRHWLLTSLALVVAPFIARMPWWLSLLPLLVMGWHVMKERRCWRLPPGYIRVMVVGLAVVGIVLQHHTILGRDAGTALLALLLTMKLLEFKGLRDAALMIFLGYFLVAGSFLYDQSLLSGGYLFATVVALTATLVALHHPAGGAADSRHYLQVGGTLLLQALPIAVLLFLLFPRLPGPLWSLPRDAFSGRTGLSEDMSIGSISSLADSDEVAFRVRFFDPIPPADRLYWRGPVLWHTDGRRWTRLLRYEYQLLEKPQYQPLSPPVRYSVILEPANKPWLMALDLPGTLPPEAEVSPDFQVTVRELITRQRQYEATSYTRYQMRDADLQALEIGLELPKRANPRTRALAEQWVTEGTQGEALVQRALDLIHNQPFYYTRNPPLLTGNVVDQFLFETRRGFCEHYSAAFVTLMRAGGVPARIVTGYQGGEPNRVGDYLTVRQSDAHAWAEVWLEGKGWVRVDPTAAVSPNRIEEGSDVGRFSGEAGAALLSAEDRSLLLRAWHTATDTWEAVDHAWTEWVLGYGPEKQQELLERLGLLRWGWRGVITVLFSGIALVVLIVAIWLLWQRPRPPDPLLRQWLRFCAKLARRGLPRAPGEGPRDYAARVASARPDLGPTVMEIAERYQLLRYGPGGADAGARRTLAQQVTRFSP